MDNVGAPKGKGNMKWCHSTPSAWIQVCPAPEEFLNDTQVSTKSSPVKWCCPVLLIS